MLQSVIQTLVETFNNADPILKFYYCFIIGTAVFKFILDLILKLR